MASAYVVASSKVQIYLKVGTLPAYQVATGTALSYEFGQNVQDIYAIGQKDPIDRSIINSNFTGSLTLQAGELSEFLNFLSSNGQSYSSILDIPSFSITKTSTLDNALTPYTESITLNNCAVENDQSEVNRNDPETLNTIQFRGTQVVRDVANIA